MNYLELVHLWQEAPDNELICHEVTEALSTAVYNGIQQSSCTYMHGNQDASAVGQEDMRKKVEFARCRSCLESY